jgi:AraC-like DNA-binding protein
MRTPPIKTHCRALLVLALVLVHSTSWAQQRLSQDSLDLMEDEALLTLYNTYDRDSIRQEQIARTYLDRARRQGDTIKMARGYDRLARIFHTEKNLAFADSIIALTGHMQHKTYPAMGYMIKGFEYHVKEDLINSTRNFIQSYKLAKITKNVPQQVYALDYIIFKKIIWGDKNEALKLQRERHHIISSSDFFDALKNSMREGAKINLDQMWLSDLIISNAMYGLCYLRLNRLDSAKFYLTNSKKIYKRYVGRNKLEISILLNGIELETLHFEKKYEEALKFIETYTEQYGEFIAAQEWDNIHYIEGNSLISMGEREEGIKRYQKIDSALHNHLVSIKPYHKEVIETLLQISRDKGDKNAEIHYLNELISADSVYKHIYRYFEPGLIKNFETPKLLEQKQLLISALERENSEKKRHTYFLLGSLFLVTVAGGYYAYRQHLFKQRFMALREQLDNQQPEKKCSLEIPSAITADILSKLDEFAASESFLDPSITQHILADRLGTNSNYLSRVVNFKLGRTFPDYLNDLRVGYALKRLSEDKRFRHYTIKAIAQSSGYKSADSFSRAFYKRHGIYPSYYLKKLEEEQEG